MSKPIKNNSQLLYLQARQLFEQARTKFENGTIKSEPKLIDSVFHSFQEFFTSMGKPNLIPRYAPEDGPPWSEDYNSMMTEVRQDLELLFQEVDILGRSLHSDFNHNMVQHEIISKQFEEVLGKMRDLEAYSNMGGTGIEFGRDDFLNKDKIDYSRISGTPLEIIDGAVTLPQINRTNVAEDAQVTIITGNRQQNKFILGTESNGFPGNNTEIHSVTDDVLTNRNYIPTFLGEENNHSDYTMVLDGSPNTWFEYEKVNVREHDKISVAKNLGWDYQVHENQTIAWAEDPNDGILKLHMQITLKEESVINQINCNMYTPPNYNAKTAVVKDILVSDGKSAPKSVMPKNKQADQYSFHFPPVSAKVISVTFEQSHKYITDIGHIFYEKKMQVEDNSEYAMDMATKKYKYAPRVEGPLIALEDLGIKVNVNSSSVEAVYPQLNSSNTSSKSIGETINRLMGGIDTETVDMGVEKFEGFRWCIGIRDIEVFSCEYADEGELVTHPFYFDKPVDKISLESSEITPASFTSNDAMKYEWIDYYVSIDDGATWNPITPIGYETISKDQPPKIYTVRTIETVEQKLNDKTAYIESEYPVYSLRMKVVATRPDDYSSVGFMLKDSSSSTKETFAQSSPIISGYMFNLTTVNDAANSEESEIVASSGDSSKPNMGLEPALPEPPPVTSSGESLIVKMQCKRKEWCIDNELVFKGTIETDNELVKAELIINNEIKNTIQLSGKTGSYEFKVGANTYPVSTITAVVKAYDSNGSSVDSDIINMVDCSGLPSEDQPQDCIGNDSLTIVLDKKISELCVCKPLNFYGSVQGPNPVQEIIYYINGVAVDPENLGEPPTNDPCGTQSLSFQPTQMFSVKEKTDEELLEIEDFGEWLEAFEEANDCGCKNKKQSVGQFQMQSNLFRVMNNEASFQVTIPYWKLKEIGIVENESMLVEVVAYDTLNKSAQTRFEVVVQDCENPPFDENGNPRVRDCLLIESIEVHYFNEISKSIENAVIPFNALPYDGVENGIGTGITVGWSRSNKAPVIMHTKGYDKSGYAFQIHAVGLNYLNEYDQPKKEWAITIGDKSSGVTNESKMLGDPSRSSNWVNDIKSNGIYTNAPSLKGINDYAVFGMSNEWNAGACNIEMDFVVAENRQPDVPALDREDIYGCNTLTHLGVQVYDETSKSLKMYKFGIGINDQTAYPFTTKNGSLTLNVGWSSYFEGPAIQIKSGSGSDNVLLAGIAVIYMDVYGESQTAWSTELRYKTNGTQNPEFATGELKALQDLWWVMNGSVDYDDATFIGSPSDIVSYTIDQMISLNLCEPLKSIDGELGVDADNPPDVPVISFRNPPAVACVDDEITEVNVLAYDKIPLSEVEYSVTVNGQPVYGPFSETLFTEEYLMLLPLRGDSIEVGDFVQLAVSATNQFGVTSTNTLDLLAEVCTPPPPPPPVVPCDQSTMSGGSGVTVTMHELGSKPGVVHIDYNMYGMPDRLDAYYKDVLVASTNGLVSNTGRLTFNYAPVDGVNEIKVILTGNTNSTGWDYVVNCPS